MLCRTGIPNIFSKSCKSNVLGWMLIRIHTYRLSESTNISYGLLGMLKGCALRTVLCVEIRKNLFQGYASLMFWSGGHWFTTTLVNPALQRHARRERSSHMTSHIDPGRARLRWALGIVHWFCQSTKCHADSDDVHMIAMCPLEGHARKQNSRLNLLGL